jgi:hypothetical protein
MNCAFRSFLTSTTMASTLSGANFPSFLLHRLHVKVHIQNVDNLFRVDPWHDLVAIQASIGDERRLFLIFRVHEDLVVARKCIHKVEQLVPGGRVDQCIDAWEREAVFWTGLVEVSEVYKYPPLFVGFLHHDYIRQPVGVVDFLDELCLQELLNLHNYGLNPFRCELPFSSASQTSCQGPHSKRG